MAYLWTLFSSFLRYLSFSLWVCSMAATSNVTFFLDWVDDILVQVLAIDDLSSLFGFTTSSQKVFSRAIYYLFKLMHKGSLRGFFFFSEGRGLFLIALAQGVLRQWHCSATSSSLYVIGDLNLYYKAYPFFILLIACLLSYTGPFFTGVKYRSLEVYGYGTRFLIWGESSPWILGLNQMSEAEIFIESTSHIAYFPFLSRLLFLLCLSLRLTSLIF